MKFDKRLIRRGTSSYKWDYLEKIYGKDDITAMWVADSDFEVPKEVKKLLVKRAKHGAFGYTGKSDEFFESFVNWVDNHFNWKISKKDMVITPGIVAAINWAVHTYTNEGDKIIVQSPVYYPFFNAIKDNNRIIVDNQLVLRDGKYYMDFEDLKNKIDDGAKMIILCSPHNPVTRVWTKDELKELGELCIQKGVLIISDEIHCDLVFDGHVHTPTAMISEEIADNTITLMAPSKTFNIAGLEISTAVITNPEIRKKFIAFQNSIGAGMSNVFGIEAFTACYNLGEKWLAEQMKYIKNNVEYVKKFVDSNMPKINVIDPEGTYLLWVDVSCLGYEDDADLKEFLVHKVGVAVNMGTMFGAVTGKNFIRFNLATQLSNIKKVLNSFKQQYDIRMNELNN